MPYLLTQVTTAMTILISLLSIIFCWALYQTPYPKEQFFSLCHADEAQEAKDLAARSSDGSTSLYTNSRSYFFEDENAALNSKSRSILPSRAWALLHCTLLLTAGLLSLTIGGAGPPFSGALSSGGWAWSIDDRAGVTACMLGALVLGHGLCLGVARRTYFSRLNMINSFRTVSKHCCRCPFCQKAQGED